jgi:cell division protein FtsL
MKRLLTNILKDALRVVAFVALLAIPTSLLLTQVYYEYRVTELGYEISEATTEKRTLTEQKRRLKIERAMQARSERVTRVAERRFGLERVGPDQVWTVEPAPDARTLASNDRAGHEAAESRVQ